MDRNTIDTTSAGALMDKTPMTVRHLILSMSIDGANISCEAAHCWVASTKHTARIWNFHLTGAPYIHVPHFEGD
ncbi:hypothetical protein CR513_41944, partial [Mucuna pruriens]